MPKLVLTPQTLSAAGAGDWLVTPADGAVGMSLAVTLSSGASLTYKVQHSLDDPNAAISCTVTRSSTTATLAYTDHGLTTSDSVIVRGVAPFNGQYAVASVVDANTITFTVAASGSTSATVTVAKMRVFDHDVLTGKTVAATGNYILPVAACRLNVTAYTSGKATLTTLQAVGG